ncbi:MAG: hypothetical protein HKO06_06680 [Pseudomonadales bacterium]|nr:hypothetical protein [Pseudomonadales bacterium]
MSKVYRIQEATYKRAAVAAAEKMFAAYKKVHPKDSNKDFYNFAINRGLPEFAINKVLEQKQ